MFNYNHRGKERWFRSTTYTLVIGIIMLGIFLVGGIQFSFANNGNKPYAGQKIVFLVSPTPTVNKLIDLIPTFEEKTGIDVRVESVSYDSMIEKETLDLRTKQGKYDVFWVEATYLERYNILKGLADLKKLATKANINLKLGDFPDPLKEAFSRHGSLNVLPFESNPMVMAYRKDLLKKVGLSVPANWEQYIKLVKALDKLPKVHGTSIMGARHEALFYEYLNFLWGFGGRLFDENMHPMINSKAAVEALKYLKSLLPYAPKGVLSYTWTESATAFQQGDVGVEMIFPDWTAALKDPEKSKIVGKWAYAPIPGRGSIAIGGYGWAVNAYSKHQEAALKFAYWATSEQVQRKLVKAGATLSRLSVMTDPEITEENPYLKVLAKALQRARPPMKIEPYFELYQELALRLNEALSGSRSAQSALDLAQKEWVKVLRKGGYID